MPKNYIKSHKRPLLYTVATGIFLVVILTIIFLTTTSYIDSKNVIISNNYALQEHTEATVANTISLIDQGLKLYDSTLDNRMKQDFVVVLNAYNKSGQKPGKIDFTELKERLGGTTEIYFIDPEGIIEYTSDSKSQGLDFNQWPYFYEYITKLRLGNNFSADRIVRDAASKEYFKYAYLPTPDHKYLIELGHNSDDLISQRNRLSYIETAEKLSELNPNLKTIRIFDSKGSLIGYSNLTQDPSLNEILTKVTAEKKALEIPVPQNEELIRYNFIDLSDDEYASDMSVVVELTYTTGIINAKIWNLIISHLIIGCLAILMGLLLAYFTSRHLTRPINEIVEDVDIIARGNFEHSIRRTDCLEYERLENSINIMVENLRDYSENLEHMVENRTRKLHRSEERLSLACEAANLGIWDYNFETGKIVYNRQCYETLGYTPKENECDQKSWNNLLHPDDKLLFYQSLNNHLNGKKTIYENTCRILRKDGHWIWIYSLGKVIQRDTDDRPVRMVGVHMDVTQSHNDQAALIIANSKLNLLSSITRHDILNQITGILGYLTIINRDSPEKKDKCLETIKELTNNIKDQIQFTRDYEELGVKMPAWQNVENIVQKAAVNARLSSITPEVSTGSLEIYADPLLEKVFFNLLENISRHGKNATLIKVSFHETDNGGIIVIEDNGAGIPESMKTRIFKRGIGSNTGFGLYLVKEILLITNMDISETGKEGVGARFEITVPKGSYRVGGVPGR